MIGKTIRVFLEFLFLFLISLLQVQNKLYFCQISKIMREDKNINQNKGFTSYNWFYQSEGHSVILCLSSLPNNMIKFMTLSLSRDKRFDLIEVLMEMSITFPLPDTCACF